MAHRVHPAVERSQTPGFQATLDRAPAHAQSLEVSPGHNAVLPVRERTDSAIPMLLVWLTTTMGVKDTRAEHGPIVRSESRYVGARMRQITAAGRATFIDAAVRRGGERLGPSRPSPFDAAVRGERDDAAPAYPSRNAARRTFPLGVFGSSAAKSTTRGYL